jgi:hypothetical protein
MAMLQALFAVIGRLAGRILNTLFSWATVSLFGKVPEDRQVYLSIIAFGSVAWMIVLLGIAFPDLASFLIAFIPLTEWVDDTVVRIIMLLCALLIPLIIGALSLKMVSAANRPSGVAARAKVVVKGYPYTLGLALTFLMMLVFGPIMKLRTMFRRQTTQHIAVVVEAEDYLTMLEEVQRTLAANGWKTERRKPHWMLRLPTQVFTTLTGGVIENLVADNLTTLQGDEIAVTLHPSDLVLRGQEEEVIRARAIITQQLAHTGAYMTWTKEANELEDRMRALWIEAQERRDPAQYRKALATLEGIEQELESTIVSYEEWEVLFREKLMLETRLLRAIAGIGEQAEVVEQVEAG